MNISLFLFKLMQMCASIVPEEHGFEARLKFNVRPAADIGATVACVTLVHEVNNQLDNCESIFVQLD